MALSSVVVEESVATVDAAWGSATFRRLAGAAGIGFVLCVVIENILRGAPPANDSSTADIMRYYTDQRGPLAISSSLYILTIPLLLTYAAGLAAAPWLRPVAASWARVGMMAAQLLVLAFAMVAITDVATNVTVTAGESSAAVVAALFRLHAAAFTVNEAVLAVALGAFALAAYQTNGAPRWLALLGLVGAATLLLGALPIVPVVEGSPWGLIGLFGFVCWLLWVVVTSVRLWRTA